MCLYTSSKKAKTGLLCSKEACFLIKVELVDYQQAYQYTQKCIIHRKDLIDLSGRLLAEQGTSEVPTVHNLKAVVPALVAGYLPLDI